jgi:hypothetical protein
MSENHDTEPDISKKRNMNDTATRVKMFAYVTFDGTACYEAAICGSCMNDPKNLEYVKRQAYADDIDIERGLVDCSENDALQCCICGTDIFDRKE